MRFELHYRRSIDDKLVREIKLRQVDEIEARIVAYALFPLIPATVCEIIEENGLFFETIRDSGI